MKTCQERHRWSVLRFLLFSLALVGFVSTANAGLNTDAHVGNAGSGSSVDNGDGSYTVFDEAGVGDIWRDGDDFQYFYDSTPWGGDFSAAVSTASHIVLSNDRDAATAEDRWTARYD